MPYQRKTRDELEVQGDYGQGWECATGAATRREARDYLKEYRANEPGVPFRIKVIRVPVEPAAVCEGCAGRIGTDDAHNETATGTLCEACQQAGEGGGE
jgi:hypothetical protein